VDTGKQIADRLDRVNVILRTIRAVDLVILNETDRNNLIKGVCQSLVTTLGYYNAWIALLDENSKFITAAEAGIGGGFQSLVEKIRHEGFSRCGQQALIQLGAFIISDPASTCLDCPLAQGYGGRSGIAARLFHRSNLYGLLCASIPTGLVEEKDELSLFKAIADDVAFALHKIGLEEDRKRAEEAAIVAQEEERKRIARELHDETAQALASLGMEIGLLARVKKPSSKTISSSLEDLQKKTENILVGVRSLSKALRPPMLKEFGLVSALEELIGSLAQRSNIKIKFNTKGKPRRLSSNIELTLYRIAQEGIANVMKHSDATSCDLTIIFYPTIIVLKIVDNGKGFKLLRHTSDFAKAGKLGLAGMQERTSLIGGKLKIESYLGIGTTILFELPLPDKVSDPEDCEKHI
jgi:signal transduction histidine kinase